MKRGRTGRRDGGRAKGGENETGPEGWRENRGEPKNKNINGRKQNRRKRERNSRVSSSSPLTLSLLLSPFSTCFHLRLYRFSSSCCSQIKMDASPRATVETHSQLPACAIHSKPEESSFSPLLASLPLQLLFCLAPSPSHADFIHKKKPNTPAHPHRTKLLSAILSEGYRLRCEGSGCARAPLAPLG